MRFHAAPEPDFSGDLLSPTIPTIPTIPGQHASRSHRETLMSSPRRAKPSPATIPPPCAQPAVLAEKGDDGGPASGPSLAVCEREPPQRLAAIRHALAHCAWTVPGRASTPGGDTATARPARPENPSIDARASLKYTDLCGTSVRFVFVHGFQRDSAVAGPHHCEAASPGETTARRASAWSPGAAAASGLLGLPHRTRMAVCNA
jgi:hypothetical protein